MRNLLILLSLLLTPTCLCYTPFNPKISAAGTTRRKALSRVLNFVGVTTSAATILGTVAQPLPAYAAPTIYNTPKGVKYAVTAESNGPVPLPGDFVVVEYTGYLSNGQVSVIRGFVLTLHSYSCSKSYPVSAYFIFNLCVCMFPHTSFCHNFCAYSLSSCGRYLTLLMRPESVTSFFSSSTLVP